MGIVVQFPVSAPLLKASGSVDLAPREGKATVLILPVVRIERYADQKSGGNGPDEGKAPGRRRRRRARS